MNRTFINLLVDLVAGLLFLSMAATGYILWFALPPGTNRALSLWGLTRHAWGDVHAWISFALLSALLVHVGLHWQWVVSVVRKRLRLANKLEGGLLRTGMATATVVAGALGLFGWVTNSTVQEITHPEQYDVCPPGVAHDEGVSYEAVPATPGPTEEVRTTVAFWEQVYPVLERACLSCHGPRRQWRDFRVDRREDLFGTNGKPAFVVPGNSAASPLIALVSGERKDLSRADAHILPQSEIAILKDWIDAGAVWPDRPAEK